MSLQGLENTLKSLSRVGTLVKDRGYRQIWRFEHEGKAYYLKFYPRANVFRRLFRGSAAMNEFRRLQWLQKAGVPAPHAIAVLMGFRIGEGAATRLGDAVLLDAIEPSVQLDAYLNDFEQRGQQPPDRLALAERLVTLVEKLGKARLGHSDLHLGNFLLKEDQLYLLDGYAVRRQGLKRADVMQLGHSVARYATRTDLFRGWERLGGGEPMPKRNPVSPRQWRKFIERCTQDNRYFGRLKNVGAAGADARWSGWFFKHFKYPHRWAAASRLDISLKDWQTEWPALLQRIEADALTVLKRSRSGDVLAGEVVLAGRPIEVIVKRPRRRYWYRYLNEIGRGTRARRAWHKAWNLIVRNIPTAWPLLLMEKRVLGYVVDSLIVFEHVSGKTLATADLDAIEPSQRDMLFRRAGRILRKIERYGFSHFDAKASNWIVQADEQRGPSPILIDVDGIRRRRWITLGIQRLLRSMREHPRYSSADSLALCQGYAPNARLQPEQEDGSQEKAETSPTESGDN